jgi:dynactin-4
VPPNHSVFIPTAHFTVGASKDAWAYDDEEDDDSGADDDMVAADERGKPRMTMLGGSMRHRGGREAGIEKRGNVTKVAMEVEVLPGFTGPIEVSLTL